MKCVFKSWPITHSQDPNSADRQFGAGVLGFQSIITGHGATRRDAIEDAKLKVARGLAAEKEANDIEYSEEEL